MQIMTREGQAQEFNLTLEHYQAAATAGMTLPQYLANTVKTDAEAFGTPFEQLMMTSGMYLRPDRISGARPPSLHSVLNGETQINMGTVVRPDGTNALTPSGRLLFPAVVLELIESQLRDDTSGYTAVFNRMVATTASVDSPRVDQPVINLTAPRAVRSQPIAQGAEPTALVSITLSEKSFRIPTHSIGLEISDEAAKASALDLVGIAISEQAEAERVTRINEAITKMVAGDTDLGISALSSETFQSIDAAVTVAGTASQKAWLKWLRKNYMRRTIDWVICDIDTYLAIEGRANRPQIQTNRGTDERLNVVPNVANPGLQDSANFFLVETAILGANTLVGIDSRKAIRKVVYAGATYQAIEQFVMRRTTALRIDFAEMYHRLIDEAWQKATLTVA